MDASAMSTLRKAIREAVAESPDETLPLPDNPNPASPSPFLPIIKDVVRTHPSDAPRVAADCVILHLRSKDSEERLGAMLVADVLFRRSQAFRSCLVPSMEVIISNATGCKQENPLPPPKKYAKKLPGISVKILEAWAESFGQKYKPLALAWTFVKTKMKLHAPSREEVSAQRALERREAELQRRVRESTVEQSLKEVRAKEGEIRSAVLSLSLRDACRMRCPVLTSRVWCSSDQISSR